MDQSAQITDRASVRELDPVGFNRVADTTVRLNEIAARLRAGDTLGGMQSLIDDMRLIRSRMSSDEWRDLSKDVIQRHDIAKLVFQCPLTRRSSEKPRGYAGDAELLDHIYGLGAAALAPHPATLAGQLYFYTVNSPACRAVRRRREILAEQIEAVVASTPHRPEILSLACGHLREAELSDALARGDIARFVALDQDEDSLLVVEDAYGPLGVEARVGTVRSVIGRKTRYENFDFVYAAGLFDYLADPIGQRLVERLFDFLRPGGRLLIANFTPSGPDVGYMETFMDWWLLFRTPDEMRRLFATLPAGAGEVEIFTDKEGVIVYAIVTRKA